MKERQEERLHPPLKGALGVAPLFGFLFSERARKEQIGVWGYPPTRGNTSLCSIGITKNLSLGKT